MPAPMYGNRGQRPSSIAKKAARNAMFKAAGTSAGATAATAATAAPTAPASSKISQQQLDRVVQSVNDATKRLSQPESAMSGSTTTQSSKRKSRDTVGPWKLGKTLGKGSSGRVRLAKNVETGQLAAIKIVPKKKCKNEPGSHSSSKSSESDASATMNTTTSTNRATTNATTNAGHSNVPANPYGIEREIVIMKLISHPNVLGLYEVWENKSELYLVLEYVDGGELFDYLVSKGKLGEREAVHYFKQVVQGVSYCHEFNICHRDLKPENLLLDKKNKSIKIADFGMAALEVSNKLLQTSCGSPHYASPEIVMGRPYHGGPSDVWSCGIILFALLTGHLPFNDDNIKKLLLKVQSGRYRMPQNLSPDAKDLISKILVVNPFRRIPTSEILNHPLLTKYDKLVKPVKYRSSGNLALSHGKSNCDLHVLEGRSSKIVKLRSRADIDESIVSNLQILWHGASRPLIVSKLLQPTMSEEKLFYTLLLNYKEKHSAKPEPEAPPSFKPTVGPEVSSEFVAPPTQQPAASEIGPESGHEEEEHNDIEDTSAPKLQQKSQFSTPSIKQESMSGLSSMKGGDALSSIPSLPSNSFPPAMPTFPASSSRTFKNSGSALSILSKKSLKRSSSKVSLSHSGSKRSLQHSASKVSLQPSPSIKTLQHSISKKSLYHHSPPPPPKKTLQNSASKRSLYSQTSISKRSLNLSEYVATENAVISGMEQQLMPNLPSSDSNGDFERLCEQILFGNALDKILEEEEEEDTASLRDTSNVSEKTLTKTDVSPSIEAKDEVLASADFYPQALDVSHESTKLEPRPLASEKSFAEDSGRTPFRDITNVVPTSGLKTSKLKRDTSQKSNLSEALNSKQLRISNYGSVQPSAHKNSRPKVQDEFRHTAELRSMSENRPSGQPSYSLDPRRNASQPVNSKGVETLLQDFSSKPNKKKKARKSDDWTFSSGSNFDNRPEVNFDNSKLDNLFGDKFNSGSDSGLDDQADSKLNVSESEHTSSSLWQPSLRDSHTDSEPERNYNSSRSSGTGLFETSDVNVLAHSSIIQKPSISRQPSMLSSMGTFKNLHDQVHGYDDHTVTPPNVSSQASASSASSASSAMNKHSTELTLAPRSTLTAALDTRERNAYTNSFLSNMSDMSDVIEMPTNTHVAHAVEVSNNSSTEQISEYRVDSDREMAPPSSQDQQTTATFEDNNINIFEDAPVDSESIETASTGDSQQNVRRKAVSIDTLHTTNVLTPATNVRVSLYMNNNANADAPLKRETTEEIISKFKLSPEKSSQPLVQKRFSAAAANMNSDVPSTMTMFKDVEEASPIEPANEDEKGSKPNRVTMLFDNEEDFPQLKQPQPEGPNPEEPKQPQAEVPKIEVPKLEVTKPEEPKIEERKVEEPNAPSKVDEKISELHERAMRMDESLKTKRSTEHPYKAAAKPPTPKAATAKPPTPKVPTQKAPTPRPGTSTTSTTAATAASAPLRKQNWFSKLFDGFKSQRKAADAGRLQQDHFSKISFDDAHLLTLHEFDKNAVEYHLKGLEHKLHDEKVEYDCKFPNGFAFKIKITSSMFPGRTSTVITVKKKGRTSNADSRNAFNAFNHSVAKVIREAEHQQSNVQ